MNDMRGIQEFKKLVIFSIKKFNTLTCKVVGKTVNGFKNTKKNIRTKYTNCVDEHETNVI